MHFELVADDDRGCYLLGVFCGFGPSCKTVLSFM